MGAQFKVEHANFVAYLTALGKPIAPHAEEALLAEFLSSLSEPGCLISSTKGSTDDWTSQISNAAAKACAALNARSRELLNSQQTANILGSVHSYFTGYDLYALILPSGSYEQDTASFRFFTEVALTSESRGLVLMPSSAPGDIVEFLTPSPVLRALADNPVRAPAVVFWTASQSVCVLPLSEAKELYRTKIVGALEENLRSLEQVLETARQARRAKRILHLSDFHFGRSDSDKRRTWLKGHLASVLPCIDRVVVTGDLFDEPKEEFRTLFDEFRADVENLTHKELIVIPGNHDVRKKGNAWWRWGRKPEYITDLRWSPVEFDDDLKVTFISFNSSATGNFARGTVGATQRRDRGVLLDKARRRKPEIDEYLKIALVHHHPYSYGSQPTALYERMLSRFFGGEEKFIAFEEAEKFLEWCAARGVSLVLHGHKHIPHLVSTAIPSHTNTQDITVIGCGSTTGVDGKPMCYDIIVLDPATKRWNVSFYHDPKGDGGGFALQNVAIDFRESSALRQSNNLSLPNFGASASLANADAPLSSVKKLSAPAQAYQLYRIIRVLESMKPAFRDHRIPRKEAYQLHTFVTLQDKTISDLDAAYPHLKLGERFSTLGKRLDDADYEIEVRSSQPGVPPNVPRGGARLRGGAEAIAEAIKELDRTIGVLTQLVDHIVSLASDSTNNRTPTENTTNPDLALGLQSAEVVVASVERIYDRVLTISDRKKKTNEISRLYKLLDQIRIGRTLNMGLQQYVTEVIRDKLPAGWQDEKNTLVSQIEESLRALVSIIDLMAEEEDRVVLYKNEAFVELSLIAKGRGDLLQGLKELDGKDGGRQLEAAMQKYEKLSRALQKIGHKLAAHGRDLDKSLH